MGHGGFPDRAIASHGFPIRIHEGVFPNGAIAGSGLPNDGVAANASVCLAAKFRKRFG